MKYDLKCDFAIGDVIEVHDFHDASGKWEIGKFRYVDQIRSVIFNDSNGSDHPIEIWLGHFAEMPGRSYIIPDAVVRIIEKSGKPNVRFRGSPPFKIGTRIVFEETLDKKSWKILDTIQGFEVRIDNDGTNFQYKMKDSGYSMEPDEFEVLK